MLQREGRKVSALLTDELERLAMLLPVKYRSLFGSKLDALRAQYLPHIKRLTSNNAALQEEIKHLEEQHKKRIAALFEKKLARVMKKMRARQESFRFVPKKQKFTEDAKMKEEAIADEQDVCAVSRETLDEKETYFMLAAINVTNVDFDLPSSERSLIWLLSRIWLQLKIWRYSKQSTGKRSGRQSNLRASC